VAYVYCDSCGVGFHSNVHSCPECGSPASRAYEIGSHRGARRRRRSVGPLREEVETEVREAIYGWRSGTVALCDGGS